MEYTEYEIVPLLKPYIISIWSMESTNDIFDSPPMRILPDNCVEMVIHFNNPFKTTFSNKDVKIQPISFIISHMKSFIEIQPHGKAGFMSIRFSAYGASKFFSLPMKELANQQISMDDFDKNLADEFENRIYNENNNFKRSIIIQEILKNLFIKNYKQDKTIEFCLLHIQQTAGNVSIKELSRLSGISSRHLLRKFNNYVGVSPKEFSGITKFLNAIKKMNIDSEYNLTENAYEFGYYDQAHFIHDFKKYSGVTPTKFLQRDNIVY